MVYNEIISESDVTYYLFTFNLNHFRINIVLIKTCNLNIIC